MSAIPHGDLTQKIKIKQNAPLPSLKLRPTNSRSCITKVTTLTAEPADLRENGGIHFNLKKCHWLLFLQALMQKEYKTRQKF